jgi:hypothetical protein
VHLDRQTNNNVSINTETIRIKKLIELFEPIYNTSKSIKIKEIYKEHIESLKNDLKKLENNLDLK